MTKEREKMFGLLAEFSDATALLQAVTRTREEGYSRIDAYAPFPVEGLSLALGTRRSPVSMIVLIAGLLGVSSGYLLQYYCAAIGYPINVAGRPLNSVPAFVPVSFELTILFAALSAFMAVLLLNGLPRLHHPLFNVPAFGAASQDKFFVCIEASDPRFDPEQTETFLKSLNPLGVYDVPLHQQEDVQHAQEDGQHA